jgi:hypothetical protein
LARYLLAEPIHHLTAASLRPFTLTLLILGLHTCSIALSSTSIPFKALSAPDTVWTEAALKVLERSYRLLYPEQRRFSIGPEDDRFEGAKLVKKPGDLLVGLRPTGLVQRTPT